MALQRVINLPTFKLLSFSLPSGSGVSYQSPCVSSAIYVGLCLHPRPERLSHAKKGWDSPERLQVLQGQVRAGTTSSCSLTVCSQNLELTAPLFVSPPEEKNKEKEKGGDNSTDTAEGTQCGSTGDGSILALTFCSALPFLRQILPSLVIYCFPCLQGAEPPRATARQGFLDELSPNGAWQDSGYPFLPSE